MWKIISERLHLLMMRGFIFFKLTYLSLSVSLFVPFWLGCWWTGCPSIQQCTAEFASHFLLPSILAEIVNLVSSLASDTTVKAFEKTRSGFCCGYKVIDHFDPFSKLSWLHFVLWIEKLILNFLVGNHCKMTLPHNAVIFTFLLLLYSARS